jgi:GNAT superfamily N-acetyltransferase
MGTIPEVRGAGAGAAIIEFACAWCQEQGGEMVVVRRARSGLWLL